jgi:AraC-like DNA-binding protein/mannose-6-phosphate isomerase-like protein (cupin superfamily)
MKITNSDLNTIRSRNRLLASVVADWQRLKIGNVYVSFDYAYYHISKNLRQHGLHEHSFMELSYIRSGSICYKTKDAVIPVDKGGIFCIPPGIPHSWKQKQKPLLIDSFALVLKGDLETIARLNRQIMLAGFSFTPSSGVTDLFDSIWMLTGKNADPILCKEWIIHHLREAILRLFYQISADAFISRESIQGIDASGGSLAEEIKDFILTHIPGSFTLEDLSEHFHYSGRQLNRIFQMHYGKTINNFLIDCRMSKAREMLLNNDMSIKAIAYSLGFRDVSYFCRCFKTHTRFTPQQFRNNKSG